MDRRTLLQTALAVPFTGVGDKVFGKSIPTDAYSPFNPQLGKITSLKTIRKYIENFRIVGCSPHWVLDVIVEYEKGFEKYFSCMDLNDKQGKRSKELAIKITTMNQKELFNNLNTTSKIDGFVLEKENFYLLTHDKLENIDLA